MCKDGPLANASQQAHTRTDCLAFHAHPTSEGTPTPLDCLFDPDQVHRNELYVAVVNTTRHGWKMKNDESLGYLTPADSQPFYDVIAAVERDREAPVDAATQPEGDTGAGGQEGSSRGDDANRSCPPDHGKFLAAFTYGESLTSQQKDQVQQLLIEYRDCFAMDGDALGLCNRVTHSIDTLTDKPVVSAPYRIPKSQEAAVKELVEKMLQQNLIRKSNSEYSSPVVLVEKPDKSLRFCVNYQKRNAICRKRTFPLPNPDELLAKIGENSPKWFSSSDLAAAFHQIPLREQDKDKTAFILPFGLYCYQVLPMGLTDSPWTFARLGQEIFGDLLAKDGLVLFIDDLCMYGPTFEHHMQTWRKVLGILRENNLKLKPSKTHLFKTDGLKFLGHHVGPKGIAPNPAKLKAISQYPTPKTVKNVRAFVALCSYFRKHVPKFASLATLLNALTRKGVHFKWTSECEEAFNAMKSALENSNLLAYPQFQNGKSFIVATDASNEGLGGWLSQEDADGNRRPIAFYSRTFNSAEAKYSTIEKEALAIVACIQAFHYYLHGRHFELESDHAPLKYVLSSAQRGRVQNNRLERWKLALQGIDMSIRYVPGHQNIIADALSRGPLPIDWRDFQAQHSLDDPDIGIGVAALFQVTEPATEAKMTSDKQTANAGNSLRDRHVVNYETTTEDGEIDTEKKMTAEEQEVTQKEEDDISRGEKLNKIVAAVTKSVGTPAEDAPNLPDLKELQREDQMWQPLIEILEGKPAKGDIHTWKQLPDFALNLNGILTYQPRDLEARLVIPRAIVPQIIKECHSHPMAGHYHAQAVLDRIKRQFYWPSMTADIQAYCKSCEKCQSKKQNRRDKPAPLGTTPPSYGPWETLHTDLMGPFPETDNGNRWILLVVCAFTKFVELIPLKECTAEAVALGLVATFHRYGLPNQIVSDNGAQYRAKLLNDLNKLLGVKHIFISAYHSQANSNAERMCGTVKTAIATALDRRQRDWDTFLGATQYAVNSSV